MIDSNKVQAMQDPRKEALKEAYLEAGGSKFVFSIASYGEIISYIEVGLSEVETSKAIVHEGCITRLDEGEDFFEKIAKYYGNTPKHKGDIHQLAIQSTPFKIGTIRMPGSDHHTMVKRPDYTNATIEVLETWKWTGRKWEQQK